MCLALPVQERCAILSVPEQLHCAQGGFGHENRVYLSGAGVVSIIAVLLWQGMDQKTQRRRQLCHVTLLQDYPNSLKRYFVTWCERVRARSSPFVVRLFDQRCLSCVTTRSKHHWR